MIWFDREALAERGDVAGVGGVVSNLSDGWAGGAGWCGGAGACPTGCFGGCSTGRLTGRLGASEGGAGREI